MLLTKKKIVIFIRILLCRLILILQDYLMHLLDLCTLGFQMIHEREIVHQHLLNSLVLLYEQYYRLRYTTPKAKYDGKKHFLEITTILNEMESLMQENNYSSISEIIGVDQTTGTDRGPEWDLRRDCPVTGGGIKRRLKSRFWGESVQMALYVHYVISPICVLLLSSFTQAQV